MLVIFLERYCYFHLNRAGKDFHLNAKFSQRLHYLAVELRN